MFMQISPAEKHSKVKLKMNFLSFFFPVLLSYLKLLSKSHKFQWFKFGYKKIVKF